MNRYIGIDPACMNVRSYAANSKGKHAVVKLEIEVNDHDQLGWLLREIAQAQAECMAARASEPKPEPRSAAQKSGAKKRAQIGQTKILALPYFGSDEP